MGEGGAVGEGQAQLVDAGAGPQGEGGGAGAGGDAVDVVVVVAVRAAVLVAELVGGVARPGEADADRVVVGEHEAGVGEGLGVLGVFRGVVRGKDFSFSLGA